MSISKKILPIEPFNDIWYKNCFYNALIPVIQYYLGRIDSYIISDLGTVYIYEDMDGVPSIISNSLNKIELFGYLEKLGIRCKQRKKTAHIIKDIKNAILNDRMVIVWIDCYYEKERSDTYHVNHWGHTILVHGFSNEKFYIAESKYKDSVIYENREIPCEELKECYEGCLNHFKNTIRVTYCEFSCQDEMADKQKSDAHHSDIVKSYLEEMVQKRKWMEESVDNILLFAKNLTFTESEEFYQKIYTVIDKMNNLINNLQVNRYLMDKLFLADSTIMDLFNEAIRLWRGVRACFAKIYYSKLCSEALMEGLRKKLMTLHELEKKRISLVLDLIEENKQIE